MNKDVEKKLRQIARDIRIDIIRMLTEAGSGHPGGSLSAADIITYLFFNKMRYNPQFPGWQERDRFILSKGHAVPALYAAFAKAGYIKPEELNTLRKIDSRLQGHPDRVKLPGIEASTGSLGQGLSIAVGMALAGKMDKAQYRVYCMIGDGESQAGQVWESAMVAPKLKINNLSAILDYNKVQLDGTVKEILDIEPVADKWRAFNWNVIEIDGHNFVAIERAFSEAEAFKAGPSIIIAHTIKGKGVSFMEGNVEWHGKSPSESEQEKAVKELLATEL